MNSNIMSKLKPYILVVCLQFGMAGIYVISMATLNRGMSRYVLIVYRNAVAALFLAPFALIFERFDLELYKFFEVLDMFDQQR